QAMGGALGPASDLYALGCILYHIITGHPPFTDDSPQAVLHCHVKRPPLPPSRHVAGVPAPLDALVLQLLAKDPRQRPSQPMALLAALNRVGAPGLSQLSQVPGAPLPTLAPLVHSPAMAGRDALVDTLLSQLTALDEADGDGAKASKQGLKRRWLVVGASGVGKSRVALEVARQARQANANVLACQPGVSDDSAPQRPLSMFRRLLLAHRRQVPKPAWNLLEGYLSSGGQTTPTTGTDVSQVAEQVATAVLQCVDALTQERPALLVFDDLQWADTLSLAALERLLTTAPLKRWMMLVLARTDEPCAAAQRWFEQGLVREVALAPLEANAVDAMLSGMLGSGTELPKALKEDVQRRSKGNPLFIVECVRDLIDRHALTLDDAGLWSFTAPSSSADGREQLPQRLKALLDGRMARLGGDEEALCFRAALLGESPHERLMQVGGDNLDDARAQWALERLERRGVLVVDGGEVRFAHPGLAQAALERLGQRDGGALEQQLSGVCARYLESIDIHGALADLGRLAWLWERAGERDKACEAYLKAADLALAQVVFEQAAVLMRRGLELLDAEDPRAVTHRVVLAKDILLSLGERTEALELLDQAELLAHDGTMAFMRVVAARGLILMETDGAEDGFAYVRTAEAYFEAHGAPHDQVACLNAMRIYLRTQDRNGEALEVAHKAVEVARTLGDPIALGRALRLRASVGIAGKLTASAVTDLEDARRLFQEAQAPHLEAQVLYSMGASFITTGEYRQAELYLTDALEMSERLHLRGLAAVVGMNVAICFAYQGNYRRAAELQHHARQTAIEVGNTKVLSLFML
ncbi:MAG: AAA family ATPase, partial [Myxococcota bacterium]